MEKEITKAINGMVGHIYNLIVEIMETHDVGAINVNDRDRIYTALLDFDSVQKVGVIVCYEGELAIIPKDEMPFEDNKFKSLMEDGATFNPTQTAELVEKCEGYELVWCTENVLVPLDTYTQIYEVLLRIFKDEKEKIVDYEYIS